VEKRLFGLGAPDTNAVRAGREALKRHLGYIEYLLAERDWLAGDRLSLADLAAAANLSILDYFGEVPWKDFPVAKTWYMKLKCRPCFRSLLSDRQPGMPPPTTTTIWTSEAVLRESAGAASQGFGGVMSRRLLAAVSVVLAMGVAPMAMAKAPPPPTTKAEALKRLQTWITAIGQFSAKFDLYYEHEVDFLGGLMESFTPASGYLVGDDRAAGEAWAATWVAEQRAKQAALKLERAALPTSPPAAPFPEMASQTKRLLGFRPAVVKAAEAMDVEADLYIASLEKAGRGDGDVPSLVRQTFGLTVSMLQAKTRPSAGAPEP
jgi:glutathione S-transferase